MPAARAVDRDAFESADAMRFAEHTSGYSAAHIGGPTLGVRRLGEAHRQSPEYDSCFRALSCQALWPTGIRAFHDMRHTALTNLAATDASPIAVTATAGHRSMQTTKGYPHLAGTVFPDDAAALERRMLGVQDSGTKSPDPAPLGGSF